MQIFHPHCWSLLLLPLFLPSFLLSWSFILLALDSLCLLLSTSSWPWCGLSFCSSCILHWMWISPCPCCYIAFWSSVSCWELWVQCWASLSLMTMCQAGCSCTPQLLLSAGLVNMTLGVRTWLYCSISWILLSLSLGDCCVTVPWAGIVVWPLQGALSDHWWA